MVSDQQLIEDLREFADELGKTPTQREMNQEGPWSRQTYSNHFGSWNKALEEAGLDKNAEINISKERLISDLQEFADELGKTPTRREMNQEGPWSRRAYSNHFGSWNKALEEAGLDKNAEINISKERLISDLQRFADKLGKTPAVKEMDKYGPRSKNVYKRRLGSWNKALEEAGLEINCLGPNERAGTGEEYYGENWYKQRKKVIRRDDRKCRICGDGEYFHVHHIKPRKEFDDVSNSNTLDNLITLCPSHHRKFEGRWKDAYPDEFEKKAKELIQ